MGKLGVKGCSFMRSVLLPNLHLVTALRLIRGSVGLGKRQLFFLPGLSSPLIFAVALCVMAGCSGEKRNPDLVYVEGHVTSAGEPLQVEGYDVGIGAVRVAMHRIKNGKASKNPTDETAANPEGNFKFRQGFKPGEYLVVIEQWDPHPSLDRLKGKFNASRSPIVRTINHDQNFLEIDVAKEEEADAQSESKK